MNEFDYVTDYYKLLYSNNKKIRNNRNVHNIDELMKWDNRELLEILMCVRKLETARNYYDNK